MDAVARFVAELRRLHRLAGSPSLSRLVALSVNLERPLPRSTVSDKLNGRSLPEWDFVASFVTACRLHAEKTGVPLPADAVDLAGWDAAHLRMLRAADETRADRRVSTVARAELARRASRLAQAPTTPIETPSVVPRQLPAPVRHFAGRTAELAALDELLEPDPPAGVVVCAIDGTAGIGKSALAVYWAHHVADRFPDGQLYVNLRGFDPSGPALRPTDAVRGFLEALGVPAPRLPTSPDARLGLYRSLLAGRRALLVLDNAADAAQVRPLLPGSPGGVVLVTSRRRLPGLLAAEGARPLTLAVLSTVDSRRLLADRLGPARLAAEPAAVDQIVRRCAGLPLALGVVAARAVAHPGFPLAALATELGAAAGRLRAFDSADPTMDPRSVFSWSYRQLAEADARLFRLLGVHPGPDIAAPTAASLVGAPVDDVRARLAGLAQAHLVEEPSPGRYAFHDLLRAYAIELAGTDEPATARGRLLDHYLYTAHAAALLLNAQREPILTTPPGPDVQPESLPDPAAALAWFTAEYPALVSTVDMAGATGQDTHAWQLAWTMADFSDRQGRWYEWLGVQHTALAAARRGHQPDREAFLLRKLGLTYARLDRFAESRTHHQGALDLYRDLDDQVGLAHTYRDLAWLDAREQRYTDALGQIELALAAYRAAGHLTGQARCLNSIGWCHAKLGDPDRALASCRAALALNQELGDPLGEAATWDSIGYAHHQLGEYPRAVECYRQAVTLFGSAGSRYHEADSLTHLGDTYDAVAEHRAARGCWQQALEILDGMGHPDAEPVRGRLRHQVLAILTEGASGPNPPAVS